MFKLWLTKTALVAVAVGLAVAAAMPQPANASAATAAMLPPEGAGRTAGADGANAGSPAAEEDKSQRLPTKLRGKRGQIARRMPGC